MTTFESARPVADLLAHLGREVAQADAALQIRQQVAWNEAVEGRSLLAGYDRLANLGLQEVRISLALTAVRPAWTRRWWDWLTRTKRDTSYRPCRADENGGLHLTVLIARNAQGLWSAHVSDERRREP